MSSKKGPDFGYQSGPRIDLTLIVSVESFYCVNPRTLRTIESILDCLSLEGTATFHPSC